MTVRYFTLEEANALLPEIEPVMARLLEKRAKIVHLSRQMETLLSQPFVDIGGPVASELAQDFVVIERLIEKIQAYGCVIKDINAGLLDFLAEREGRDVYLCWRYGEAKISYYHDLHTGFSGRQPV